MEHLTYEELIELSAPIITLEVPVAHSPDFLLEKFLQCEIPNSVMVGTRLIIKTFCFMPQKTYIKDSNCDWRPIVESFGEFDGQKTFNGVNNAAAN